MQKAKDRNWGNLKILRKHSIQSLTFQISLYKLWKLIFIHQIITKVIILIIITWKNKILTINKLVFLMIKTYLALKLVEKNLKNIYTLNSNLAIPDILKI